MIAGDGISARAAAALANRNCLVLGGGGFIGTHLCNTLVRSGARVRAFGRTLTDPEALDRRVIWTSGDFDDTAALAKAVEGQETVFHLISASVPESSNRDPAADLLANTIGTINLLDLLRAEGVGRIVFTSSGGTVYGIPTTIPIPETEPTDPISAYGINKLATEKYLALYERLHGLSYRVLRIANPYGRLQSAHRRQGVVAALLDQAVTGRPLEIWGTGDVVRDFIHVHDVVAALLEVHGYEGPHRIMNVGSGEGRSVSAIADAVETVLGGGRLERIYRKTRTADVPVNVLDTTMIRRETGWHPRVPWEAGLRDTLQWIRSTRSGP